MTLDAVLTIAMLIDVVGRDRSPPANASQGISILSATSHRGRQIERSGAVSVLVGEP